MALMLLARLSRTPKPMNSARSEEIKEARGSEYLFPSPKARAKIWAKTLQRAGVTHFSLYELRHTFCNPAERRRRRRPFRYSDVAAGLRCHKKAWLFEDTVVGDDLANHDSPHQL